MIKFKEHDGLLFKMLEEPVPLTPDAEMPCLVSLIQDDSPIGKQNKQDFHACVLAERTLVLSIDMETFPNTVNSYYEPFNQQYYWRFEIIGTPVAEGSAEWRNYQLVHGFAMRDRKHVAEEMINIITKKGEHND